MQTYIPIPSYPLKRSRQTTYRADTGVAPTFARNVSYLRQFSFKSDSARVNALPCAPEFAIILVVHVRGHSDQASLSILSQRTGQL